MKKRSLTRSLKLPTGGVDFTSNDYLGLARSAELHAIIEKNYSMLAPKRNGSSGSRLLSGNSTLIEYTESSLAQLLKSEATLIFDSGYTANLAVLSTLPQHGDTIIMDELSHASLKDGARLSLATKWNFRHNDIEDLRKKLSAAKGEKWVVVESIYSMDGDTCPLREVVEVSKQFNAHVILDEAHSTGCCGPDGSGIAVQEGLAADLDVRVYTFGKAMGIHGACVACSSDTKDLLINFSRPFIYTTAPSDHSIVSISSAFGFLKTNTGLQEQLRERIELFRSGIAGVARWNNSATQIQIITIPGPQAVLEAASVLQSNGYDVRPILSPTVREGSERLRICLHTYNTNDEIEGLTTLLKSL